MADATANRHDFVWRKHLVYDAGQLKINFGAPEDDSPWRAQAKHDVDTLLSWLGNGNGAPNHA